MLAQLSYVNVTIIYELWPVIYWNSILKYACLLYDVTLKTTRRASECEVDHFN